MKSASKAEPASLTSVIRGVRPGAPSAHCCRPRKQRLQLPVPGSQLLWFPLAPGVGSKAVPPKCVGCGGPGPLTQVGLVAAVTDPSHRGCWPRKGKESRRAPNYRPMSCYLAPGLPPTPRGPVTLLRQGGTGLGSKQVCGQQSQHGQRKQGPRPSPLPCQEGQACGLGRRQWWGWLAWKPQLSWATPDPTLSLSGDWDWAGVGIHLIRSGETEVAG